MRRLVDTADYDALRRSGRGVIYNDFSPNLGTPSENRLHLAGCRHLARSNLSVAKLAADDLRSAVAWLERNRGAESVAWFRCATCLTTSGSRTGVTARALHHAPSPTLRTAGVDWTVDGAPGIVLADLPRTIQFQSGAPLPRWMTDAKAALRVALRDLEIAPTHVLEATLAGHLDPGTDLENVLLYNVGVPATALARGLRLRHEAEPSSGRVVHRYRAVPARPSTIDDAQVIATITATVDRTETSSARRVWAALRRRATFDHVVDAAPDLVAMRLSLGGDWRLSVDVIKRILDASCAAFHVHDGTALDVVSDLLAAELDTTAEALRTLALDARGAALGPAPFLEPWGSTVRVHPQDDRITAIDVDVAPAPRPGLHLSATLVRPSAETDRRQPVGPDLRHR